MHGAALAFAITCFFAEQLGKHPVDTGALSQAVAVTAVGAGDIVIRLQRFAHAYRNGLFSAVQVSQAGHAGSLIQIVDGIFETANFQHLLVHMQPLLDINRAVKRFFG